MYIHFQARWQLRFLSLVTSCRDVIVTSRNSSAKFINDMKNSNYKIDKEWNIVAGTPGMKYIIDDS